MIRKIERTYFEVWGNAESQNLILKWLLLVFGAVIIVQSICLAVLGLQGPALVAVGEQNTQVLTIPAPTDAVLEREARRTLKAYIENHYSWTSKNVDERFTAASKYVAEKQLRAFQVANADQIRAAKEKKLSQRVYISALDLDMKARAARFTMDRILEVEGIRAVTPLVLDLKFEFGARTQENSEGIYVISEKNITPVHGG